MIYTVLFGYPTNDDTKFDNKTQRHCLSNLLAYSMGDAVVQFQADVFAQVNSTNTSPHKKTMKRKAISQHRKLSADRVDAAARRRIPPPNNIEITLFSSVLTYYPRFIPRFCFTPATNWRQKLARKQAKFHLLFGRRAGPRPASWRSAVTTAAEKAPTT